MMRGTGSRFWGVVLTLGLTGMGLFFLAYLLKEGRIAVLEGVHPPLPLLPGFAMIAAAAMFYGVLRGPIGRGIAGLFAADEPADDQLAHRLEQVEDRLAELSGEHQRMAELEERVDFAERMLAQRQAPAQLPLHRTPV